MGFPFEEIARVQRVRPQFKKSAELSRRCRWPKGKFLHKRGFFAGYQRFEFAVEGWEVRMTLNGVKRRMIALITLVFPYMDCGVVN